MRLKLLFILTIVALSSCTTQKTVSKMITDSQNFIEYLKRDEQLSKILNEKEKYKVQVIYTQINRDKSNNADFKNFEFNVNDDYFYPASTVKFPLTILALQRLNELKENGIDRKTTINFGAEFSGQTETTTEPQAENNLPTIENYIKQILLVSDNAAYNRLYEFLGQDYINSELRKKGYNKTQIRHRLEIFLNNEENAATNPVKFLNDKGQNIYSEPLKISHFKFDERKDFIGKAYYKSGKLIEEPMDFSSKNRMPLNEFHSLVQNLIFPSEKSFKITDGDRKFLLKYMSMFPQESTFPTYGENDYDARYKFLFYGSEKGDKQKNIRIFNKVGNAYGQLTDAIYFVDFDKNIEFLLSATIYCNEDEILNDDKYDYETIGFPFMKRLGEVIYDFENQRKREYQPNLKEFKFNYSTK